MLPKTSSATRKPQMRHLQLTEKPSRPSISTEEAEGLARAELAVVTRVQVQKVGR